VSSVVKLTDAPGSGLWHPVVASSAGAHQISQNNAALGPVTNVSTIDTTASCNTRMLGSLLRKTRANAVRLMSLPSAVECWPGGLPAFEKFFAGGKYSAAPSASVARR
jgi:hypothetical protein